MLREKIIRLLKLYDDSPADPREDLTDDILDIIQSAVETERGRIRKRIVDEVKGVGELWFPYVGVGDTTEEEELESAEQFADEIVKELSE